MQDIIIKKCMNTIKHNKKYTLEQLEEIEYGLISIYMLISKAIIIFTLAYILGILNELIIFLVLWNIIRIPSFGLHASKSSICLISSTLIFIGSLYISLYIHINIYIKIIIGIYTTIRIFKNSPADTEKRPIINKKRRIIYKYISTLIAIIFVIFSIFIKNKFIGNSLIFSLIIQTLMISPYIYKLFNMKYDNYKDYIK